MLKKFESFKKFSDKEKDAKVNTKPEVNTTDDTESSIDNTIEDVTKPLEGATNTKKKPNVPTRKGKEKVIDIENIQPNKQVRKTPSDHGVMTTEAKESDVKFIGKVAKFPKNVKAKNALNFLENVKISKSNIWYIVVEKQDNELQMIKYDFRKGVNLGKFIGDLKTYYTEKYKSDKIGKYFEGLKVGGTDKFSVIQNIPQVEIGGRKMISILTDDLIKLLSK